MSLLDKHTARKVQQIMTLALAGALAAAEHSVRWSAPAQDAEFEVRWVAPGGSDTPYDIVVTRRQSNTLPRTVCYALYAGFCIAHKLSTVWANGGEASDS
jgi:hypothetical protein